MKQAIRDCGAALGGRALGLWVADNTAQAFSSDISSADLASHLHAVQQEIAGKDAMPAGFVIHAGSHIELEGEIFAIGHVQQATVFPAPSASTPASASYPHPFGPDTMAYLNSPAPDPATEARLHARYARQATVVAIKTQRPESRHLLDRLTTSVLARAAIAQLASLHEVRLAIAGEETLAATPDPLPALEFARAAQAALKDQGLEASVGLATGTIWLFPKDISGQPVSRAAKLTDHAHPGAILIDHSVPIPCKPAQNRLATLSGTTLTYTLHH